MVSDESTWASMDSICIEDLATPICQKNLAPEIPLRIIMSKELDIGGAKWKQSSLFYQTKA